MRWLALPIFCGFLIVIIYGNEEIFHFQGMDAINYFGFFVLSDAVFGVLWWKVAGNGKE